MRHVAQTAQYWVTTGEHGQNTSIERFAVCRRYDKSVLATENRFDPIEIYARARMWFERILKILGK